MSITLGILKENGSLEHRVAMVPELIPRANDMGFDVYVEKNAGINAFYEDSEYASHGGRIVDNRDDLLRLSDVVVSLSRPTYEDVASMKEGSVFVGVIYPQRYPDIVKEIARTGLVSFSLELIPRITRAQTMDVLSSQSSSAGYRGAVLAASNSPVMMPMLTTAAGTLRPSRVLVIGAGVAGLMAIATARRLGANVSAFDVRRSAGEDVRSLGAKFLETTFDATGEGGYARDLSSTEKEEQQRLLDEAVRNADVVITAAGVPGKTAPRVVSERMINSMNTGSVIVDLMAESGGNCDLTRCGETVTHKGVRIIGPENPPSDIPRSSSQMYTRNIISFLSLLVENGHIRTSFEDEILRACLVTKEGEVVYRALSGGGGA